MNEILVQIDKHMHKALKDILPEVSPSDLEDGGAVFYMNGKNGTVFDWYVNEHLPCFFIFYGDRENLGAVKAMLYTDGNMSVYVYGDNGHAAPVELNYDIDTDYDSLFDLAVLLTENADVKLIWDTDIRKIDSDGRPDGGAVAEFTEMRDAFGPMIERKNMLGKTAIISKKVREGGWKIGYGIRFEPTGEGDSGWCFSVGDESEDYINDPENLELWAINSVLMYDPALSEFITAPFDSAIVRVSADKFETDAPEKEIYIQKADHSGNAC